jgi:hypothetical protein
MAALLYLKRVYALSDEGVVQRWCENPYWQHFGGERYFQHELPSDPSSLVRWRQRIGEASCKWLLANTIEAAKSAGVIKRKSLDPVVLDITSRCSPRRSPTPPTAGCSTGHASNSCRRRRPPASNPMRHRGSRVHFGTRYRWSDRLHRRGLAALRWPARQQPLANDRSWPTAGTGERQVRGSSVPSRTWASRDHVVTVARVGFEIGLPGSRQSWVPAAGQHPSLTTGGFPASRCSVSVAISKR